MLYIHVYPILHKCPHIFISVNESRCLKVKIKVNFGKVPKFFKLRHIQGRGLSDGYTYERAASRRLT